MTSKPWHRNNDDTPTRVMTPAELAAKATEAADRIAADESPGVLSCAAVRVLVDGEWVDVTGIELNAYRDPGEVAWVLTLSATRRKKE